ncbi:NADH:quinone oxidoreductase/Mrp antiporter, membrane subunit, mitochondrion [Artemisia annua]|uniref:NADH:quinone oxidoreductase/Mrp antiporter, membrane subunit, mitochondrion n=1 Tax=Artemisia annua TaxID=35608 RepID=A0A2U1Q3K3_ARTAN|nr:NADH:quinone oxidoreductase/Mrp antiporter, membrane subunit, mitochondrion [Artemisia annua]
MSDGMKKQIQIAEPSPSDSISLLTLYMRAPDIYDGSPTPVISFFSIAPKISISSSISRLSIYGSYGATLQQIFFFCSIASMILGALAAMAQTKVKRLLAHNSIGHVGYIRTGFSSGMRHGIPESHKKCMGKKSKNETDQMIVPEWLFLTIAPCDAAEPWQLGSQDAATPMMQGIIEIAFSGASGRSGYSIP